MKHLPHDGFHTNSRTNSTQDHAWSPFLMVFIVTAMTIPIFDISSILNIQLHYQDSCEYSCSLLDKCSYALQEFVAILWVFSQNPKSNFIAQKSSFF